MTITASAHSRFVTVNGLRLHYLDWGGPSQRVLLLLHGITGNCHVWDPFAVRWREQFRIFSLDQRGHGDSDHAREGYPVTAFAEDVAAFARALGLERFDLAGISLGARNALPLAAQHPELVRRLVLVDCGPEVGREGARGTASRVGQRPIGFRDADEAAAYFRELNPNWPADYVERLVTHGLRRNWANKLVWKHDPELVWITLSAGKREVPFLWEECARIACPTLILRGEQSTVLTPDILDRMLAVMPRAEAVVIPNAGHSIHADQPEAFERAVLSFLRAEGGAS